MSVKQPMKDCCLKSARRYLKRHRDVALCDGCGFLLMAYGDQRDYEETLKNLAAWEGEYATGTLGELRIVAKARSRR